MAIARFGKHLDPETLLRLYRHGMFPMADSADDPNLFVIDPDLRGIIPLDDFHLSRRLRRTVRQHPYTVTIDRDFSGVVLGCAESQPGRENTWINPAIHNLYTALHQRGNAHSVECWEGDNLVGGLYGVSIGGAFFGESMFSRATDASKIALVHLVARLIAGGYRLLDTQFVNAHLMQFGIVEIERNDFLKRLQKALAVSADFHVLPPETTGQDALQFITQTS